MARAAPEAPPRRLRRPRRTLWLSVVLIVVSFVPFALVFSRTGTNAPDPLVLTDADQKSLTDGLRMVSPSFSGRTKHGEPYTVTADWALPNGPKPTRVTLHRITARIVTKDGRENILTSQRGVFFPRRNRLQLSDGIVARTSDGYTALTESALVDLNARTLETEGAFEAEGPRGSLRADRVEAVEGTERTVVFRGNVRVVFQPESVSPRAGE